MTEEHDTGDRKPVDDIVSHAIDELNELLPLDEKLAKLPGTPLAGEGGNLDSLSIVNLVVILEQKLEEKFGQSFALTEDGKILEKEGALGTVGGLTDYLLGLTES